MASAPPCLDDPDLPAVGVLLGPGARGPLQAVLAQAGSKVDGIRPRQVTWWPGRSITVRYDVTTATGRRLPQIVACAGEIPDGVAVVASGEARIGFWALPHDPVLSGLAAALDPDSLRPMLASGGLITDRVSVRLRAYRPARRAVVQVDTDSVRVYLKTVPPASVARLHDTHRRMAGLLPVPMSFGFDPDLGILVMSSGRGRTLRETLDEGGQAPPPGELDALLASLPAPPAGSKTRSPINRLGSLTDLLGRIVPDQRGRIEDLVGRIGEEPAGDRVASHGDFHDGQILVEAGRVTGLLDVDTYGPGHLADDPATMLGHLGSRRPHAPRPEGIGSFTTDLRRHWLDRVDAWELTRRTAAVMLGLATGPFRVQQSDWPDRVRDRIARAEEMLVPDESPLIAVLRASHRRPAQ